MAPAADTSVPPAAKTPSKSTVMIALLKREDGATLDERCCQANAKLVSARRPACDPFRSSAIVSRRK
jgi:hypothetical protein